MKTLFLCEELNYKNVKYDTRIYSLDQRYVIVKENRKYVTRIASIKFNRDGTREINLELEKNDVAEKKKKVPVELSAPTPSWIENMINDIEGKKGRVFWNRRRRKRRF